MNYGDLAAHRLMVRDEARTSAFREAISAAVRPGAVVLDLGAGCGILSLFAAQAGAARVYAVERDPNAAGLAQALVSCNGFGSVVHVVQSDVRAAQIPEPVDLIVAEWLGTIGLDENLYGGLLWARDHLLAPEGRIIPAAVKAVAAPAAPAQRPDTAYFAERPYGLDLAALTEPAVNELLMVRRRVVPQDLAAPAQTLWTNTALDDPPALVRRPVHGDLDFTFEKAGAATALALWFEADLGEGVTLCNAPSAPDTHWGQMLLPFEKRHEFSAGDRLRVVISAWPVGPGPLMFAWRWQINDGPVRQLSTAGTAQVPVPESAEAAAAPPMKRSDLTRYLATLAVDADRLADFLADPARAAAKLDPGHAQALMSRDPYRIAEALFEPEEQA